MLIFNESFSSIFNNFWLIEKLAFLLIDEK